MNKNVESNKPASKPARQDNMGQDSEIELPKKGGNTASPVKPMSDDSAKTQSRK